MNAGVRIAVSDGTLVLLPARLVPPAIRGRRPPLGQGALMARLRARSHGDLAPLRRAAAELGLRVDVQHASDTDLLREVERAVEHHRLVAVMVSHVVPAPPAQTAPKPTDSADDAKVGDWPRDRKITVALRRSVSGPNISRELRQLVE